MSDNVKEDLITQIVEAEWVQFDKVNNQGGRASCQDDRTTFFIMRKSQFEYWTEEMLSSYLDDLHFADATGWNLLTEKYARMMESTDPIGYDNLKDKLPHRSSKRIARQNEVVELQVEWMEALAEKFPKVAGRARSIRSSEDSMYNTSYETYLRGELGTYSDRTFNLYYDYMTELKGKGDNLALKIIAKSANMYGYEGLEDAEESM